MTIRFRTKYSRM